ncbi:RNA polymerase sigma factor [Fulvivirgaceae bacterium BMA10]|uniref:RNA polymerase sigma factor n=1 Tax=Splendidivirga corallicola TaxID=3051826 RepID=A0ABT8KXB2_9BACT|nr:RNA polymerase sigma factor [Fulvivirgaceae bacterium BMA10]
MDNNSNNISVTPRFKGLPDEEVILKIREGQKELYELIIRKYNERLYRIARSFVQNEADVKDIMQDSYIRAFEKLDQFKGRAKFSTWLTKIFINTSLAKLKQNKQQRERTVDLSNELFETEQSEFISQQNEEQKIIKSNIKKLLENSIDHLPEKYRTVFMMREVEGINVAETADCLNISEENVKVRLHRAKIMLKDLLKDHISEIEIFGFRFERCDRITAAVMGYIDKHY